MSEQAEKPGFLVVIQKVTSIGQGESIQVSFNLPMDATTDDLADKIDVVCGAMDKRLVQQNARVLANAAQSKAEFAAQVRELGEATRQVLEDEASKPE